MIKIVADVHLHPPVRFPVRNTILNASPISGWFRRILLLVRLEVEVYEEAKIARQEPTAKDGCRF
jgi:hypothetical protein